MRQLALALVLACGQPTTRPGSTAPAATSSPVRDRRDAIARFKAEWQARVHPLVPDHADRVVAAIDRKMTEPAAERAYSAEQPAPCRERAERVSSLDRPPDHELIVIGTVAELAGHDRCWSVMFTDDGFTGDAEGFLDADSGELLLVWLIPEG